MSFLQGAGAGGGLAALAAPTGAATGLGKLLGADPSRIGDIAGGIGKVANGVASAGGATPAYADPGLQSMAPDNHMQLLDNAVLQRLISQFGGQPGMQL
jgi:hypothetical protein